MKILITIGHPAHVHYFKESVKILIKKGHKVLFAVRDRECIIDLLEDLGFNYICFGKGGYNMLSKLVHIPIIDFKVLWIALMFKPDYFLSFASPYASHVAFLLRKPHITFDDTEHAKLAHKLYRPFSDVILSPYVYMAPLHKRQVLFDAFMELFYLRNYSSWNDEHILSLLGIKPAEPFCLIRFISWDANHDVGIKGLSFKDKLQIVEELQKKCRVFISSESLLPSELEAYRLTTHPAQFHQVIQSATLCISEGSTTASEAALLGIPTIYVNPLKVSNCNEEEEYGLLYQFTAVPEIVEKSHEILNTPNVKAIYAQRRDLLLSKTIDPTPFLVWFLENYPESKKIMKENPNYQYRFK